MMGSQGAPNVTGVFNRYAGEFKKTLLEGARQESQSQSLIRAYEYREVSSRMRP